MKPGCWCAVLAVLLAACTPNEAPQLQPLAPQTAFVGARLDLKLLAFDPDGDRLAYSFIATESRISERARLATFADHAVFSWTPGAADVGEHAIDFVASDGQDNDVETVLVTVRPGTDPETAPVFRRPLGFGTTLDLERDDCIDIDVLVEDPDSLSVTITQDPPIANSSLQPVGGLAATFSWCPDAAQKTQPQHTLVLWADDEDHPPVSKSYTIRLRTSLPPDCPGAAPQVLHTPPGAQQTTDDIAIQATVTDDHGLAGPPLLYYTTEAPPDPAHLDFGEMQQLEMAQGATPALFEAAVPNPTGGLDPGQSRTLYYVIVAEDDDDPSGNCDHRTQVPEGATYQVVVTRPTTSACTETAECPAGQICGEMDTCESDACTPVDSNADGLYWEQGDCPDEHFCPQAGEGVGPSHCAATCESDADCGGGRKCKVFDTKPGCAAAGSQPVGASCASFTDCAGWLMCLPWAGGYCSLSDCDSGGSFSGPCPTGSVCYPMPDPRFFLLETHWICVATCTAPNDCRSGYSCQQIEDDTETTRQVCLPEPQR